MQNSEFYKDYKIIEKDNGKYVVSIGKYKRSDIYVSDDLDSIEEAKAFIDSEVKEPERIKHEES